MRCDDVALLELVTPVMETGVQDGAMIHDFRRRAVPAAIVAGIRRRRVLVLRNDAPYLYDRLMLAPWCLSSSPWSVAWLLYG